MKGTIVADVYIYSKLTGKLVMLAKVGDKVVGSGSGGITELWRGGSSRLPIGTYTMANIGCVAWEEVTPPPDPTGPTLTHTIKVYSDGSIEVDGNPVP